MANDKIFIDRTPEGDFLMRMPAEAMADFYQMIVASPLLPRRWFYQVKEHLETKYPEYILREEVHHEQ
jgi:hypothetical protein